MIIYTIAFFDAYYAYNEQTYAVINKQNNTFISILLLIIIISLGIGVHVF